MATNDNPLPFDPSNDDGFLATLEVDPSEVAALFTDTASDGQAPDDDGFSFDDDALLGNQAAEATPEPPQATNGTDPAPMPDPAAATPQAAPAASVPPTPTSATSPTPPTPAPALPAATPTAEDPDGDGDEDPDTDQDPDQAPPPPKRQYSEKLFVMVKPFDVADLVEALKSSAGTALLLWTDINRRALESESDTITASIASMAALSGLSRRSVIRSIDRIEALGLIAVRRKKAKTKAGHAVNETNKIRLLRGCYTSVKGCAKLAPPHLLPSANEAPQGSGNLAPQGSANLAPCFKMGNSEGQEKTSGKPVCSIPAQLDFPEFREAWESWQVYRRELKRPLVPSTIRAQLEKLATRPGDAVAIIRQSIANAWQGLFPLKDQTAPRLMPGRAAPVSQLDDMGWPNPEDYEPGGRLDQFPTKQKLMPGRAAPPARAGEDMGWPNPEDYEPGGRLCRDKPKYADKSQGVRHAN